VILALSILASMNTTNACAASGVLSAVRRAMGGAAWNQVQAFSASGRASVSGVPSSFRRTFNRTTNAWAVEVSNPYNGSGKIFDGVKLWRVDSSGWTHQLDAPIAVKQASLDAFIGSYSYLDPAQSRSLRCLGTVHDGNGTFYRFTTARRNELRGELWIDAHSLLPDRLIERMPTHTYVTTWADYRQTDGVALPFSIREGVAGDPIDDTIFAVERYELRSRPYSQQAFRPPPLPADHTLRGPTSIPFKLELGQIIVDAFVNGKGPLPFLIDTGGHDIVTMDAARTLGIPMHGAGSSGGGGAGRSAERYARLATFAVGPAHLRSQTVEVLDMRGFTDRTPHASLAGIIGLEFFERYRVTLDFDRQLVRIESPAEAKPHLPAERLWFEDDMPLAYASVDRARGLFGLDTGNSGETVLFEAFLRNHHLLDKYRTGGNITSSGTGGVVHSRLHVVRALTFGPKTFRNVLADFITGQSTGSFASWSQAGNIGYDVLARYNPTFDYRSSSIFLAPSKRPPQPVFNRAGFGYSKQKDGSFSVRSVRTESPAADAELRVGDAIIQINATAADALSAADFGQVLRAPAGSRVTLRVREGGSVRSVVIILRDLPPP
jgi:hypothetical protein